MHWRLSRSFFGLALAINLLANHGVSKPHHRTSTSEHDQTNLDANSISCSQYVRSSCLKKPCSLWVPWLCIFTHTSWRIFTRVMDIQDPTRALALCDLLHTAPLSSPVEALQCSHGHRVVDWAGLKCPSATRATKVQYHLIAPTTL